ncbi:MAG TPA: RsmE family RNA methyltransferase [Lacipirellulaceae bacterium]|nr:RsmE family RNA methyltransferase [Lacipirellulaceae bacterium]
MSERFYSSRPINSDHVTLDGPEAHHLLHVMRAATGDVVTLFDGRGAEFQAVVETLRRSEADLKIIERHNINRELPFPLVIGVALPKGDRQKWLVEKLTELGAAALAPLITERSVAQPSGNVLERLRRAVIEAAKQCGRNRLMMIAEPQLWHQWINDNCESQVSDCGISEQSAVRNPQSEICKPRRLVAHRDGPPSSQIDWTSRVPTQIAVGPEGGFTNAELEAAEAAGWQIVSLGPRTLRTETAAVALAASVTLAR